MKAILTDLPLRFVSLKEKWIQQCFLYLIGVLIFCLPIEHKYDKIFRKFSLSLIPQGLQLPSHFDKKIYFYASDLLIILLAIGAIFLLKTPIRRFVVNNGAIFLLSIFMCCAASIYTSSLSHYPVIYTRLLTLLSPILLFSLFANLPWDEKALRFFAMCLIGAALLQSFFAISQYFTQESLGLRLFSESRDASSTFTIPNGQRWIFDSLFHYSGASVMKRSSGTLPHCNILGGLLAMSILASYTFIAKEEKKGRKYLFGASLIPQLFALTTTFSRSAIFGLILGTIVFFSFAAMKRKLSSYPFLGTILAISAFVFITCFYSQYLSRGGIINYNLLAKSSDLVRITAQQTALQMIQSHPLLGVGYAQYSLAAPPGAAGVHNIYLFLSAESGLIALAAFLFFIAFILFSALRSPFTNLLASLLSIFIALLFIGGCDFYPLLSHQGKLMLFITAGMIMAEVKRVSLPRTLQG